MVRVLLASLLLLCGGVAGADSLRIATYNVRLQLASDHEKGDGWEDRREALKALIRYHHFEVMGLQEVLHPQLLDLLASGDYAAVGVGRDDGATAGEYSPILYLKEHYALAEGGTFWLSETPDRPSFGWDAQKYRRICTWARLRVLATGREVVVFNSHFDHEAVVARREAARLLLARAKPWVEKGLPVIVLGDFNSVPDSEPYRILAGGLVDSRALSRTPPYGPEGTFNGFQHNVVATERIDHVFLGPKIAVERHGTLTDAYGVHYPSDHFPVVVDLIY